MTYDADFSDPPTVKLTIACRPEDVGILKAWEAGYNAFSTGEPITANPYVAVAERNAHRNGYTKARAIHMERQ